MRRRGSNCGRKLALAIGSNERGVAQISYQHPTHKEPGWTGYTVFFEDAPVERDPRPDECWTVCTHCLAIHHPETEAGMKVARRSGAAVWHEGAWAAA